VCCCCLVLTVCHRRPVTGDVTSRWRQKSRSAPRRSSKSQHQLQQAQQQAQHWLQLREGVVAACKTSCWLQLEPCMHMLQLALSACSGACCCLAGTLASRTACMLFGCFGTQSQGPCAASEREQQVWADHVLPFQLCLISACQAYSISWMGCKRC